MTRRTETTAAAAAATGGGGEDDDERPPTSEEEFGAACNFVETMSVGLPLAVHDGKKFVPETLVWMAAGKDGRMALHAGKTSKKILTDKPKAWKSMVFEDMVSAHRGQATETLRKKGTAGEAEQYVVLLGRGRDKPAFEIMCEDASEAGFVHAQLQNFIRVPMLLGDVLDYFAHGGASGGDTPV